MAEEVPGYNPAMPDDVVKAAQIVRAPKEHAPPPPWAERFVWMALWKFVVVALVATLGALALVSLKNLIGMLLISLFFALAIIPGVEYLTHRFNMRRGAAVGIIYVGALLAGGFLIAVLIPAIVEFANAVGENIAGWYAQLDAWFEKTLGASGFDDAGAADSTASLVQAVGNWADHILGILGSGLGLIFSLFTIAAFTFYFAADFPRLIRAIMRRMPPERQKVAMWITRTSIEQTGGYFYSRLLLMVVNGGLGFIVMLIVGSPLVYAMPLAIFMGFVSAFIPFIGTYLGAAVPILVMLAIEGWGAAIGLLVYVLVYQQIENYVLSPRISSKTMELNGAVAFGAAMAGGAIAGPMGAFTALPVAALITSIAKNTGRTYEVVVESEEAGNVKNHTRTVSKRHAKAAAAGAELGSGEDVDHEDEGGTARD